MIAVTAEFVSEQRKHSSARAGTTRNRPFSAHDIALIAAFRAQAELAFRGPLRRFVIVAFEELFQCGHPSLLPGDDYVLVGHAVLPRELDSICGLAHAENKGARPVKGLIEPGASDIVVSDKERTPGPEDPA